MKGFKNLQKIGRALMTPVSVLPAAGILVAVGRLLQEQSGLVVDVGQVMFNSGIAIFEQLPLIFALGVSIGFAGDAVAALAAGVGFVIFSKVLEVMAGIINISEKTGGSIESINTGVFGGIVIGIIAAQMYKKFHSTELPPYLGFFAGKRLVPIVTAVGAVAAGVSLSFIWPPIQIQINQFARFAMNSPIGPALYAAGKRALIPVGLHHVYYPPFLYEFGRFTTEAGQVLRGETARFFAGDPTAGRFMAAEYPIMLFALPAACLAMYLRAKNKVKVAGMLSTAALTSFLTGITEPIEFLFIFVAPPLYLFHVAGAFISGLLTNYFNIRIGYTFSASAIDYVLSLSNLGSPWMFWLVVGPIMAVLYFVVFYVTIPLFDFKTPGRGSDAVVTEETETFDKDKRAENVLAALGGSENLESVDACITRLRLEVVDNSQVEEEELKKLGASGVMKSGSSVQVVFGPESDALKDKIKNIM
ncbi:PTS system D-glucosamine-specific IIA component (Glc family) /PTS system D-glucosamine-specific IIB component (Glc family) /PTS system D-glucosamine-specific IIC component (Glc family) [Halanaerobium saccharolyticum]|uniref:PTS system D-glucosamine-specific IIA component (Glc family) /PTS system D-glucosamine-specific IIB component (Glc family) /PTS system D-glucosamine-specific IIC component (Glc family) n=1 Tax=Halanaerobium saccharolyticum TaxID=43595 RepID=A0A4V3CEB2_9FIRM|nr:PTS transporter subunit EIIC [Halanaerobium saccharolyticum]TDO86123.1 PTS system D-glucosamine-specific IIA component (Glc family) /PTS system D-glucosamine-specific IIB component (Glc family) /PTS system D-glucosamine-specific IIC component (Glc family) [Halanaerobium saccharolyticum]